MAVPSGDGEERNRPRKEDRTWVFGGREGDVRLATAELGIRDPKF